MKLLNLKLTSMLAAFCVIAGIGHSQEAQAQASAGGIDVAQQPLFTATGQPPLNMLVMGKDHKLYYEAYNDASDLDADGVIDVGYKPASIDYYGYFDSHKCYSFGSNVFTPTGTTASKRCAGAWSGDFLNYLTTSRMDALRKVLYGGYRSLDTPTRTVLERSYIPQDAHSWGKEYTSVAVDGYNIGDYTPLSLPAEGRRHLFANTTLRNFEDSGPLLRVLTNSQYRIWEWVSIEQPVAGERCLHGGSGPLCTDIAGQAHPGHPADRAAFNAIEAAYAISANLYGTTTRDRIDCNSNNTTCNLANANQDNYLTIITGRIIVRNAGNYRFRVNGDDAIDFQILNSAGTIVASSGCYGGRGFGACSGGEIATANALPAGTYTIKFRQEEMDGGDGYSLEWQRTQSTNGGGSTSSGSNFPWTVIRVDGNSSSNGNGGWSGNVTLSFYNLKPPISNPPAMTNYRVNVEVCKASMPEINCKQYPDGNYKPIGILHEYGETQRMYFGLLTGSYAKNTQGGVIRSNMGDFAREIYANDGRFRDTVTDGIVYTINKLRTIDFNAYQYTCGWITTRPVNDSECTMWGNPIAEMMYETLRYFAGASAPRPEFDIASNAKDSSAPLSLAKPGWKAPFKPVSEGGSGHLACSVPVMTVVSDINPSYDFSVPGTSFGTFSASGDPIPVRDLNVSAEVDAIWASEGGGTRNVFIGESNGVVDNAPTVKAVSKLSTVRGLAPEEPSKLGTYYSAGVARFGAKNNIGGDKKAQTYAVALASPLPRIDFPVGNGRITLVPFAKSVAGSSISATSNFQPTDQIVDFYVQKIANTGTADFDATVNGGLPYAEFRINYEDVEQGADHDMDAIALYTLKVTSGGRLEISIRSEYAAGGIDQHMGYVISGTTQDGIYLEVCDLADGRANDGSRASCAGQVRYKLNTPPGRESGWCTNPTNLASAECLGLPSVASRTFTPGTTAAAGLLKDPLWYAAKYGVPTGIPSVNAQGEPLNYFLVTNATNLKSQLDTAFSNIIGNAQPTASVATSTPRYVSGATLAYEASYKSEDWSGDLKAYNLHSDATYASEEPVWTASQRMPGPDARKVFTGKPKANGGFEGLAFNKNALDTAGLMVRVQGTLDTTLYPSEDLIAFLKGEQSKEQGGTTCTNAAACPFRKRGSKLGDILNSTPAVVGVTSLGYGSILHDVDAGAAGSYAAYVESKKTIYGSASDAPVLFVGANDGMLHALDGSHGTAGGKELFAYIPNAVLGNLNQLASPGYTHRFFVDGSPTVGDAYIEGWKSVLLGSTGAGARAVYTLDISNPRSFASGDVLWEFSDSIDSDMGQFIGRPYMGITEGGQWVAAFGNGYNSARQRAVLFIRDLKTGAEIAKIDTGVGCPSTQQGCTTGPNGLSTAVLVDNSGNGAADTIYAGDYLGNLWRFELTNSTWAIGNGGQPLFTALDPGGKPQSITSGVYTVANPLGGTMVIFGTGRYLNADDADETRIGQGSRASVDTVYGIWDSRMWDEENSAWTDTFPIAPRASGAYTDLVKQWITSYTADGYRTATRNSVDFKLSASGAGKMGWYMELACAECADTTAMAGERITATPQGILSDVVFNTFRPEGDSCEPGSQNATLVFDALTGAASYIPIPPVGGWPQGREPPLGAVGRDTVKGPPPGEPPIVIVRPPNPGVPCLPGAENCPACSEGDTRPQCACDPATDPLCEAVTRCSWYAPNSAGQPPGKLIPCGRISWKQLR
jgi:type IV pilus assembly protein PilY1